MLPIWPQNGSRHTNTSFPTPDIQDGGPAATNRPERAGMNPPIRMTVLMCSHARSIVKRLRGCPATWLSHLVSTVPVIGR